ncbi:protein phosphatase regulator [Sporothrix curviconia]|uniref:Protein phosphatase regulator n=1 Tax=Sporothrix curviconia TaxID=1260050 RepID=A0ABP0AZ85_9PEZI
MAEGLSKDEIISSFCGITGVSSSEATSLLDAADWDADAALAEYYQSQEEAAAGNTPGGLSAAPAVDPSYTGPRTLDGRPAPQSTAGAGASSSSSRPAQQPKKRGLMTMSSLRGGEPSGHGHGGHGGHGHNDDDDNDDDYSDDDDENNGGRGDLFAGGEKSGLAVQDPTMGDRGASSDAKRVMRDIVAQAKANHRASQAGGGGGGGPSAGGPSTQAQAPPSRFRGSGQTLGGEGVESRTIPDANAPATATRSGSGAAAAAAAAASEVPEERTLHIWQDGFSIDDGPLHRYDDPSNAADLQMIRQGRAPLHLMNVPFGQAVDIKLHEHQERWHQLPRVYRPFSGEGRRLGSPVPGGAAAASTTISETLSSTVAAAPAPAASSASAAPAVDESLPTLTIRVQLPDGTRLPARFNTTQTIGDVYAFVERALPAAGAQSRAWVLATTFPNKEHTDKDLVLGETAEFKRGGAAVVKWV